MKIGRMPIAIGKLKTNWNINERFVYRLVILL